MGNCNLLPIQEQKIINEFDKLLTRNQTSDKSLSKTFDKDHEYNKQNIFFNCQSKNSKQSSQKQKESSILYTPKFNSIITHQQFNFNWDLTSINSEKFNIVKRNAQFISEIQQPHQLISDSPLPLFGIIQFSIKIKKYGNKSNCISIGLISQQNIKEQCSCRSSESISYMTYPNGKGCILKQGRNILLKSSDQLSIGVQEQGLITFIINMNEMYATIERKEPNCSIPAKSNKISFQQCFSDQQQIYVFACMSTNGDAIELL